MEFFEVNDIRLAVEVSGPPAGPPLVLLHGGGLDKSSWVDVSPTFARTQRVYALDLRGFATAIAPARTRSKPCATT